MEAVHGGRDKLSAPLRYDARLHSTWRSAMPGPRTHPIVSLTLALAMSGAGATVGEKVDTVLQAASGVATKAEHAVKRGVKAAASGVERGAKAAGSAATKGAQKLGVPGAGASATKP
jgi:hypothetical protein